MRKKLSDLMEVRKIISISITFLFISLALTGDLDKDFVQNTIITVIAYYFGKATALDTPKGNKNE